MNRTEEYIEIVVSESDELQRIDKYLSETEEQWTRTLVQKMIHENYVLLNGKPTKPNKTVKVGDVITVEEMPLTLQDVTPQDIPLDIIYEDDDVLIVNKPSGMVVHPAPGHYDDTLVNALLFHITQLSTGGDAFRPGIVHRIDKDTSGLLMVAKSDFAHNALQNALKENKAERLYIALVDGVVQNSMGTIHAPIGRSPKDRKKMAVVSSGKDAITHFRVLERFEKNTLLECRLETGRTHQIRVHLAYAGFPVTGDPVYGKAKETDFNQFLHAKTLGFTHPRTQEEMTFSSPLPKEFIEKINELKSHLSA